jgi:hypothetical protein
MSSIIEQAARSFKGALPGVGSGSEANTRQDARGKELIKQLAVGGLALGGGTSAAVALVNYLKAMRQENEVEDESRLNDDTLYIPAQRQKSADVNRWVAPGLAVTGGILSAGGAYAITQAVYGALQRRRRQKMLDEAQNETLLAADLETEKVASSMTFTDLVTAFPVAVPLLAALASGGIAYTALNKTFPTVRSPKSKFPKRVRQVSSTGEISEMEDTPQVKSAALADLWAERDCNDAGLEYLALFTDRVAMEKGAMCITSDILNSVAKRGVAELARTTRDHGLPALCEITKGASDSPASEEEKALAAAAIFKSARLSSVVSTIAAAEFGDMLPGIQSLCDGLGHEELDKMAGLGALMHMSWHRPAMLKAAAMMDGSNPLLQELVAMLQGAPQQPQPFPTGAEEEERDAALTSDVSGSMAEDSEGGGEEELSDTGEEDESQASDDVIDSFMSAPASAPPPKV